MLCDFNGHNTHLCSVLLDLWYLLHAQPIPTLPIGGRKDLTHSFSIRTNKPCLICGTCGHYTHDYLDLPHYCNSLKYMHNLELLISEYPSYNTILLLSNSSQDDCTKSSSTLVTNTNYDMNIPTLLTITRKWDPPNIHILAIICIMFKHIRLILLMASSHHHV